MMKIYNKLIAGVIMLTLLFTSCSKDENNMIPSGDSETAILSFSTILHDFNTNRSQQKDHLGNFPICSEAAPAYVRVELTGEGYSGPETLDIALTDSPGDYDDDGEAEYFTLEDENLELPAGLYTLQQFTVYDENDNLIWVAPTTEGSLGSYVDSPLPKNISLAAGTKKYVDVEVLCYDKRMVNEYGYLFFELETNLALDFCFFANYCDENGRHFTAAYTVDIWYGTDDSGTPLYTNVGPTPAQYEGSGEYYTEPVCFALPELPEGLEEEDPYIYFEATLSDWDNNYGDVDPLVISGTLSYSDIISNFDGDEAVDYRHLRFGCGDNGGEIGCDIGDPEADCDGDGTLNGVDCDPDNATISTTNENDADCDGVPTQDDCDDNDPDVGAATTTYYADTDGDDLGDPNESIVACTQPEGYVENNLDKCPEVNPDIDTNGDGCEDEEECDLNNPDADCDGDGTPNGVDCDPDNPAINSSNENDADCDGVPTEADCDDNDAQVGAAVDVYYSDADGDGLGDPEDSIVACEQPEGYVTNNNDQCPNSAPGANVNEIGCEIVTGCTIGPADSNCSKYYLSGITGFVEITSPTGTLPDPYGLIPEGGTFEDRIGTITVQLSENLDPVVTIILNEGFSVDDYVIEVRDESGSEVTCVFRTSIAPPTGEDPDIFEEFTTTSDYDYSFFVRVETNVCPTN